MSDQREVDAGKDNAGSEKAAQGGRSPRPRSIRSWRSGRSRTRSRPSSRPASLTRIYSAGFHDDNAVYIEPADFEAQDDDQELASKAKPSAMMDAGHDQGGEADEEALEEVESDDDEPQALSGDLDRARENDELEKAPSLNRQATSRSSKSQRERDPNMVSWDGPDDSENPKNWNMRRKWMAVLVVSSFVSIRSMSTTARPDQLIATAHIRPSSPP